MKFNQINQNIPLVAKSTSGKTSLKNKTMTMLATKIGKQVNITYTKTNGQVIKKSYIANGIKQALELFRKDIKI